MARTGRFPQTQGWKGSAADGHELLPSRPTQKVARTVGVSHIQWLETTLCFLRREVTTWSISLLFPRLGACFCFYFPNIDITTPGKLHMGKLRLTSHVSLCHLHLVFKTQSLTEPEVFCFGQAGGPEVFAICFFCPTVLGLQTAPLHPAFMWVLGVWTRVLLLPQKALTHWAISPFCLISLLHVYVNIYISYIYFSKIIFSIYIYIFPLFAVL